MERSIRGARRSEYTREILTDHSRASVPAPFFVFCLMRSVFQGASESSAPTLISCSIRRRRSELIFSEVIDKGHGAETRRRRRDIFERERCAGTAACQGSVSSALLTDVVYGDLVREYGMVSGQPIDD